MDYDSKNIINNVKKNIKKEKSFEILQHIHI